MVASQFCTDSSVNSLLDYSRCVVDNICSSFDRPIQLKEIQYLVFAGMISYYGFEHIDEITKAFKQNKFLYINEPIFEFLKKRNSVSASSLKNIDDRSVAMFHPNYNYNGTSYDISGEIILSSYYKFAPDEFLESVVHEVNHAVNSINRCAYFVNGEVITRMGLYRRNHGRDIRSNYVLEEAINVLQTAEIMEHILSFGNYNIKDNQIRYLLDSMSFAFNKKRNGFGYGEITSFIRPLYKADSFNKELKNGRISGFTKKIEDVFDKRAGKSSFKTLSGICDSIFFDSNGMYNVFQKQIEGNNLVKKYLG